MSTITIAEHAIDVDGEGFLTDPAQWSEQVAEEIARESGIAELTDRHWLVVRFMRERYLSTGAAPSIRSLGKESGVPVKELYQLFPKGPGKLAARIAGLRNKQSYGDEFEQTSPPAVIGDLIVVGSAVGGGPMGRFGSTVDRLLRAARCRRQSAWPWFPCEPEVSSISWAPSSSSGWRARILAAFLSCCTMRPS